MTAPLLATAVRKAAGRLVPFLLLLYVLAFLDRVNVGYAKQAFLHDTGLGEGAFAFGASVFFIACRVASPTTCSPRVRSPYSAVLEIE